jgi:hypothetical protein
VLGATGSWHPATPRTNCASASALQLRLPSAQQLSFCALRFAIEYNSHFPFVTRPLEMHTFSSPSFIIRAHGRKRARALECDRESREVEVECEKLVKELRNEKKN